MHSEIRQAFPAWDVAFPDVVCRCRPGKPYEVEDLAKVSAQASAIVVVLGASRRPRDADAQVASRAESRIGFEVRFNDERSPERSLQK